MTHKLDSDSPPAASVPFSLMIKPIGPICNLDCEYCFYLPKRSLYATGEEWRMDEATLELAVRQYIASQPPEVKEIKFVWQGGEPTMMGLKFFERVVQLQKEYWPPGKRIFNSLQTNGVLLDDRWCEFLHTHQFLVGLSIDGPKNLHDQFRRGKRGGSTFPAVMGALQRLKRHQVDFNLLVTVNRANVSHGVRVYTYLRDNGATFLQFIPIVEPRPNGPDPSTATDPAQLVSSRSVLPEAYGDFLVAVFEEWFRHDVGRVFVQFFDEMLGAWLGQEPAVCILQRHCGRAVVLEHNGDLFACDHFVDPQHRLGNIHETSLSELVTLPQQQQFGRDKFDGLPEVCRKCDVRFVCAGECPKNRIAMTQGGQPGLNFLCAGYKRFFHHVRPTMEALADGIRQGSPAAITAARLNAERRSAPRRKPLKPSTSGPPKRNDPCPCGSGKKYKRCCMR